MYLHYGHVYTYACDTTKNMAEKNNTGISEPQKRAATTLHESIDRSVVWLGPQMTINDDIPLKFPGCTWSPVCRPGGLHEWCPSHDGLPKNKLPGFGSNKKQLPHFVGEIRSGPTKTVEAKIDYLNVYKL